jgi:hypothetical protein
VEDSIMGIINRKLSGSLTAAKYDGFKAFIIDILNSGETAFLDEFMRRVFQLATTGDKSMCAMCAKLLAELTPTFPHLHDKMRTLFAEYRDVVDESLAPPAKGPGDAGATAYYTRRRGRRAYGQFLAALVTHKTLPLAEFQAMVAAAVTSLRITAERAAAVVAAGGSAEEAAEAAEAVAEYVDCLQGMVTSAGGALKADAARTAAWQAQMVALIPTLARMRDTRAKFRVMDIQDFIRRGWRDAA